MPRPETIELQIGGSHWLHFTQFVMFLLGATAILLSRSDPLWISGSLLLLCLVYMATARRMKQMDAIGVIRLHAEGDGVSLLATNGTIPLRRRGSDWATRWCCLLRLEEVVSGRRVDCLVCRSRNNADPYRELLVRLRMRDPRNRDNMHWI